MVKELLNNYEKIKTEVALCKNFGLEMSSALKEDVKKTECLKKCVAMLSEQDGGIITEIYFEKQSIRTVAEHYGYSKSGIQYKRDKAIAKLEKLVERAMKIIT